MQLDADDNGVVRFHAKAHKDWQPIEVHLEYTGEHGIPARHTVALRGDTEHGAPLSPNEVHAPLVGGLRPPLEGDPLVLSNQELVARGYPPRPDPKHSPARYARWHRIVSRPYTAVNPRLVPHPEVSFSHAYPVRQRKSPTLPLSPPHTGLRLGSPTLPLPPPLVRPMFNSNSGIWSGASLTNPTKEFCAIQADWTVPGVFALPGAPGYSAAAEWIGLDNSGTDLYQSGTDSECLFALGFPFWTVTNYWMWIEFPALPALGCSQLHGFPRRFHKRRHFCRRRERHHLVSERHLGRLNFPGQQRLVHALQQQQEICRIGERYPQRRKPAVA